MIRLKRGLKNDVGREFEQWVALLFDDLGKLNVRHDVRLHKRTLHGQTRSQIDIRYGLIDKKYVECKYHGSGKVSFDEVAKFAGVLKHHRISYRQGVVVTNSVYSTRALSYGRGLGMCLIDRDDLVSLDWRRSYQLRSLVSGPSKGFADSLEKRILRG